MWGISANINNYFGLIATHSFTNSKLRDGMNLVAKEFVACQSDENPGVLILSPFAGAGGLMHEAIMANPYETHITAAGKTHTLFPRIVSAKTILF